MSLHARIHVFAPRHAVHTLANLAGAPARYLLICTPGGFERRFDPEWQGSISVDKPFLETHVVGRTIPAPRDGCAPKLTRSRAGSTPLSPAGRSHSTAGGRRAGR